LEEIYIGRMVVAKMLNLHSSTLMWRGMCHNNI
jgi:hypothetical protein